jgi:protein-S-isoprenylcysteine O-methyltransferase Ste14
MAPTGVVLLLLWSGLGAVFALRPRGVAGGTQRRAPGAWLGVAGQFVAFALVWFPVLGQRKPMPQSVQWLGLAVGLASVALAWAALRHLREQWAVQARLLEGHTLITSGPYALMRHPIYTAMLGMLVATGCVLSTGAQLLGGVLLYLLGTRLRTTFEERLLRQEFGETFDAYKRRVGWLLPGL